jgi:hypothetical protein
VPVALEQPQGSSEAQVSVSGAWERVSTRKETAAATRAMWTMHRQQAESV